MKVSDDNLEKISTLIDGELDNAESTIDLLMSNAEARNAWQSLYLSKDILHNSVERKASLGFSAGVMAALDDEPVVLAPHVKSEKVAQKPASAAVLPFLRPLAGLAIAATVAAVTILSFDSVGPLQPQYNGATVATVVTNTEPSIVPVAFTGTYDASDRTYWQGSGEGMQDELNRYLVDHTEHANPGGYQSIVPYVRVAGYDSN